MKKKYTTLRRKLNCIVIAIVLLGTTFFTLFQAYETQRSAPQYSASFDIVDTVSENKDVAAISNAYDMINSVPNMNRVGFYGTVISPQGEIIAESCDFVIVEKYLHDGENTDRRIMLLEEGFLSKGKITYYGEDKEYFSSLSDKDVLRILNWEDIEITGTCDFNYIYPEKIRIALGRVWEEMGFIEYVPHENKTHLGAIPVTEWLDGYTYVAAENLVDWGLKQMNGNNLKPGEFRTFAKVYVSKDSMSEMIDIEAERLSWKFYEQSCIKAEEGIKGYWFEMDYSDGLFTSTDYYTSAYDDDYAFQYMFVYHPVLMAMENLWMFYVIVFVFTLIILVIISVLVNKVYKQQLENETNRRELTRGIAHELKTPLAITKGYIENWQYLDENEKDETKETIIDEIDYMNSMITDLLELSHLEAKNKAICWEDVDILALTQSIVQRLNPIIKERGLNVTIIPDESENIESFIVEADLEMIRTAIVNYISNAVKYADKEIIIKLSEKSRTVTFVIENDGDVMDKKKIERVWDDFYKDSEYNRSSIGSSGLGLAIAKNIFILHKAKYGCNNYGDKNRFMFEISKKKK